VATQTAGVEFDAYGLRISLTGDWPEVVEEVGLDFAWFRAPDAAPRVDVQVIIERRPPDFDSFGEVPATFITPRNVVYQRNETMIIDYFGRAVAVLDRARGRVLIQGEDSHLVHEAVYLFVLSRIGEHLDARGLVRLHALGVAGRDGGVAVLLPSGGGKSTLALEAIQADGVSLISEDSPLLDIRGQLHPFPLRVGVNETDVDKLPEGRVRRIERMELHPKLVLELEPLSDRIASAPAPLRHVVLGHRTLGRDARLEPVPRRSAVGPLFREAVVGVGIYQGMEFILQRGLRDVALKAGTAARRSACCTAGLARASVWRLTMGRDHARNWGALEPLL
jgi:hypothetical protein